MAAAGSPPCWWLPAWLCWRDRPVDIALLLSFRAVRRRGSDEDVPRNLLFASTKPLRSDSIRCILRRKWGYFLCTEWQLL